MLTSSPSVLPDPSGDAPCHGREPIETALCRKGRFCIPFDDAPFHYLFKLAQEIEEILVVRWDVAWLIARMHHRQRPKALLSRDEAFHVAPSVAVWRQSWVGLHHLENMKQLFRHLDIRVVAGLMKGAQDLV
jgi:hypothetical protein